MTARFPIYLNVMTFKVSFYGSCNCCLCLQSTEGLVKLTAPPDLWEGHLPMLEAFCWFREPLSYWDIGFTCFHGCLKETCL